MIYLLDTNTCIGYMNRRNNSIYQRIISLSPEAYDLQIAAIALANNLILVTHNTREFSRIPELQVEDWESE